MDAATVTTPGSPGHIPAGPQRSRRLQIRRALAAGRGASGHRLALGVLLIATLALRLWGIRQGLPYSYNSDEAAHFVPRAVAFFSHDLNPHYFLNPPAYSYLLQIVFELWFGSADAVRRTYVEDPTAVFVVARVVAALLGTTAVALTYLAGERLFQRTVALVGAAILGLAFLPIFYSHLALNDVPALAPVALSLYGVSGVLRDGARRDYAIAGIGMGLAAATKYTGGITGVCLLGAFLCDWLGYRHRPAPGRMALAAALALGAFVVANPYSVLDFSAFQAGLATQQSLAGGSIKLGTTSGSGIAYYVWTFTWGLGWVPSLAAVAGAALLLVRRRLAVALVLLPAPILFIVYMGNQQRFFGRWLMPVFPIVALLGAYGAVALVRWLIGSRRLPAIPVVAGAAVVLLGQSVSTVVHNDLVLSRADTRNLTRAWMVGHVPAGARVVVEPVVADNWAQDIGRSLPWTPDGVRWQTWNTYETDIDVNTGAPLPAGEHAYVSIDDYERTLRPALLTQYIDSGYCWVVIGSLQAGRSFAQPRIAPAAIAYYAQLADHAVLRYHISPFSQGSGSRAVPFSFDWSIDYYPSVYSRPGPEMSVYRLTGGRCSRNYSQKRR
jgi:hypothetical protein